MFYIFEVRGKNRLPIPPDKTIINKHIDAFKAKEQSIDVLLNGWVSQIR